MARKKKPNLRNPIWERKSEDNTTPEWTVTEQQRWEEIIELVDQSRKKRVKKRTKKKCLKNKEL